MDLAGQLTMALKPAHSEASSFSLEHIRGIHGVSFLLPSESHYVLNILLITVFLPSLRALAACTKDFVLKQCVRSRAECIPGTEIFNCSSADI